MDAPAALATVETGELAFHDQGAIYLDGKNVLSILVEFDLATEFLGGVDRLAVVAETLTGES